MNPGSLTAFIGPIPWEGRRQIGGSETHPLSVPVKMKKDLGPCKVRADQRPAMSYKPMSNPGIE